MRRAMQVVQAVLFVCLAIDAVAAAVEGRMLVAVLFVCGFAVLTELEISVGQKNDQKEGEQ